MNNFEAITFTTFGYKDYTENLIASINKNQIDLDVNVYTLDNKSHEYFSRFHNNLTPFVKDSHPKEFMDQKNSDFGELMLKKFECIFDSLNKYEYVLYLDSDIVIKRNIREYLINMIGRKDILFQNDKNPKKPNQINLCAGFMMIKSNKKTLKFFNPKNVPIKKIVKYRTHDQTHINKSSAKFNYNILPLEYFPNGPYYYKNHKVLNPFIIHFNYVLGDEKIRLMKEYREWYI
tara:strand:- start:2250 stop:2948 length:699 start_codon:yes stop_codon:yes gene_type:complete